MNTPVAPVRCAWRRLYLALVAVLVAVNAYAQHSVLNSLYRVTSAEVPPGGVFVFRVGATAAVSTVQQLSITVRDPNGAQLLAVGATNGFAYGTSLSYSSPRGHYTVTDIAVTDGFSTTFFHRDGSVTYGVNGRATHSINFADADFDVVAPATTTFVGGSITHDTTWTTDGSPYVLTGKCVIPTGVTLTVAEGVTVVGGLDSATFSANRMEVSGRAVFAGTATHPVRIDGLSLVCGAAPADRPSQIDISHAVIRKGSLWPAGGTTDNGSINVRDSYIMSLNDRIYLFYPVADCTFERNVFVSSVGFSIGLGQGHTPTVTIRNNEFYNPLLVYNELDDFSDSAVVACWANDGGTINVNYNSIYGVHPYTVAWVFKLPSLGQPSSAFDGKSNYWDSLTADDVSRMILDSTKGRDYHNVVPYLPILAAPDPATPVPAAPAITAPPAPALLTPGDSATLSVGATASQDTVYEWRKDGALLAGATGATLAIANFSAANAGNYTVTLSNNFGTVTSPAVSVSALTSWLTNVSVRAALQPNQALIVGMTTNRAKSILVRAAGPALRKFDVAGTTANPALRYFPGGATVPTITNEDWNSSLSNTMAAVGAFPFAPDSPDSALLAQVEGQASVVQSGTDSGIVLVEAYDTAPDSFDARLINIAARNFVGSGDAVLIAGFAVRGTGSKKLLIRGVGPGLAPYAVTGTLANPKLIVTPLGGSTVLAQNDDWDASLRGTFTATNAFGLATGSKDSALVVTLPPGIYSAQVSGVGGATGVALVEVYEAP